MTTIAPQPHSTTTPETPAARSRHVWSVGDYARIADGFARGAAAFVQRVAPAVGERVLDVACGTGNLTLPAARLGARVTGIDIAPSLLAQAGRAAVAEHLAVRLDEGDCTMMPYADASFDTLLSMFGVMFAADQAAAGAELLRVCRPGGRIALACWTPEGFIGQMFARVVRRVPPPAGAQSPLMWGREEPVRDRLAGVRTLVATRRTIDLAWPMSPADVATLFRVCYGPTLLAYAKLSEVDADALHEELVALWTEHNRATDGTTRVESEYLEVMAER
jgi:SAM-dependent methyltransferase